MTGKRGTIRGGMGKGGKMGKKKWVQNALKCTGIAPE